MGCSVTYTYHGEICGCLKNSLQHDLENKKALLNDLWDRLKMYAATTPPTYAKSECGTEYPYPEFLVEEFNRIRDEMETYYYTISRIEDCMEAMEKNPEEVEDAL